MVPSESPLTSVLEELGHGVARCLGGADAPRAAGPLGAGRSDLGRDGAPQGLMVVT